jgi:hypothetical protein
MAMNEVKAARAWQLAAGGSTGGPPSFLRNRRTSMIRSFLSYRGLVNLTVCAALFGVLGLAGETEAQTKKSSSRRTRLLKSSHPLLDALGLLDCTDAPLGGARIGKVKPASRADQAHFQPFDEAILVDGKSVKNVAAFEAALARAIVQGSSAAVVTVINDVDSGRVDRRLNLRGISASIKAKARAIAKR